MKLDCFCWEILRRISRSNSCHDCAHIWGRRIPSQRAAVCLRTLFRSFSCLDQPNVGVIAGLLAIGRLQWLEHWRSWVTLVGKFFVGCHFGANHRSAERIWNVGRRKQAIYASVCWKLFVDDMVVENSIKNIEITLKTINSIPIN